MTLPVTNTTTLHSPADVLSEYLDQQDLLGDYTVRCNGGTSDVGDKLISFTDTTPSGIDPLLTGNMVEWAGIQIRIRGIPDDQQTPRRFIADLAQQLDVLPRTTLTYSTSTYTIQAINRTSGPLPLLQDEQRRWEWTINVLAAITQTA